MKIDISALMNNSLANTKIKESNGNINFSSLLGSKIDNNLNLKRLEEENVKLDKELLAFVASLINSFNNIDKINEENIKDTINKIIEENSVDNEAYIEIFNSIKEFNYFNDKNNKQVKLPEQVSKTVNSLRKNEELFLSKEVFKESIEETVNAIENNNAISDIFSLENMNKYMVNVSNSIKETSNLKEIQNINETKYKDKFLEILSENNIELTQEHLRQDSSNKVELNCEIDFIEDVKKTVLFENSNYTNLKIDNSENNEENIKDNRSNKNFISMDKHEMYSEMSVLNNILLDNNKFDYSTEDIHTAPIRNTYIVEDMVKTIHYLKSNNIEQLNVKINPKDLGEVNITLLKVDNQENLTLTFSELESFNLVKENLDEIKLHLSSLDFDIKNINVEIKSNIDNDFTDNLEQNFNDRNTKEEKEKRKTEIQKDNIKNISNNEKLNVDLII